MRECVFCGYSNNISKEHVWSSCLLEKRKGNKKYASNSVPNKFIGPNSLQVRDVCRRCNNEKLAELDSYFCKLYDTHIKTIIEPNDQISFNCNFSLLARWLFKTLYNNARSGNADKKFIEILSRFNQYILEGNNNPSEFLIFLQLIVPYKENDTDILPIYMTAGPIDIPGFNVDNVHTFVVCVDSFRFVIVIPSLDIEMNISRISAIIPKLPATNGAVQLQNSENNLKVFASDINTLYAVGPVIIHDLKKGLKLLDEK
ncbi:hypothetical protein [Rhodohalobacter sp. 8-1]|uniref:hypothetical protein n=1 Tax=Rhodohalobacter sp. 8-1 TaxID=3131972 RepID=UPI0030EE531A